MTDFPLFPYAFALLLALPFYVLFRRFLNIYVSKKERKSAAENLDIRPQILNAFERMAIFLERIKPSNLVLKFDKNLQPHEFLFLTEKSISEEFEFNSAQQLYIPNHLWQEISMAKNHVLKLAHQTYEGLQSNADLQDFKTVFLMNYLNGEDVVGNAMNGLKREIMNLNKL